MGSRWTIGLVYLVIIVAAIALIFNYFSPPRQAEVAFNQLLTETRQEEITKITVGEDQQRLEITYKDEARETGVSRKEPQDSLYDLLLKAGVSADNMPEIEVKSPSFWSTIAGPLSYLILPIIFLVVIFFFLRQAQGSNNQALSFGKSRARLFTGDKPKITFADVAAVDEAKYELNEVVEFLKYPEKFAALGARIPRGVLLMGPPGTGKTLLARAVAGEAGVPFFSISGSEFVEMFVGVGASVTGDTPVLIRTTEGARLVPIGEFVDRYYEGDQANFPIPVQGVETLGFEERESRFKGSPRLFFGSSAWKKVAGVYRHRVNEIYEIHYLGGVVRTTGDHSVFVRTRSGLVAKPARELQPGNVLVGITTFAEGLGLPRGRKPVVQQVIRQPYEGYVYDLCGCENEAFFGGEKPILLHNSRVRDLFDQAKRNSPAIVFIDEIDAVGRQRGTGLGGSHDEREQTLNQILVEMDGFDTNTSVIVVAASNRPDILDPALLRPGRFDRRVILDRPDMRGRAEILQVHMRGKPLASNIDLDVLARQTPGFSGADLANLVNEAAILSARRNQNQIGMAEMQEAAEKVIAGPERRNRRISEEETRVIAYHEAGHALTAHVIPECDAVHKISVVSRGMALGYTMALPEEDRYLMPRRKIEGDLAYAMGGYAAELLVFGDITTGSENDIERATKMARRMVTQFGMSESLGPIAYGQKDELVFLGREIGEQRDYSDGTANAIDEEVRRIVEAAYRRALNILEEHRATLDAIAQRLIEVETLEGEILQELLRQTNARLQPAAARAP